MDCEQSRVLLSARIDGEATDIESQVAEAHLAICADCRSWQLAAEGMTRKLRIRPAAATPDLTASIMAASRPTAAPARPIPRRSVLARRALLGTVAVAQFAMGLIELLGSDDMGHTMSGAGMSGEGAHLFNESTAWNLALGIGFAVAAIRPRTAGGLLPTIGAFVLVLTGFSMVDVIAGRTDLTRVASHLLVVAGLVLLWSVHHAGRRGPRSADRLHTPGSYGIVEEPMPEAAASPPKRRGLRPAGRHVA